MNGEMAPLMWVLLIFQVKHALSDFVLAPRYGLGGGERYFSRGRLIHALLHAIGSFPAILLLAGWDGVLAGALMAELVLVYHLIWGRDWLAARSGEDPVVRASLTGGEQLLHQLFYLAVIALIV